MQENHAKYYNHAVQYAEEIEVVSCSVDACYADELENVTHHADEIEFNFQETCLTDEEDSISIENIDDAIRLEAKDRKFRLPPKRKKMTYPQTNSIVPIVKKFKKSQRPKSKIFSEVCARICTIFGYRANTTRGCMYSNMILIMQ